MRNKNFLRILTVTFILLFLVSSMSTSFPIINNILKISSAYNTQDYDYFVQPNLAKIETIREVLMSNYVEGSQDYGYSSTFGISCGGNIEPSPALGKGTTYPAVQDYTKSAYHDTCVLIDNNLEGGLFLDYFNSPSSVLVNQSGFHSVFTNVYGNTRAFLTESFIGVGGCSSPFASYNYPSSFALLDRREPEFGFAGVKSIVNTLNQSNNFANGQVHIGGIGSNCGTEGQTWFIPGYSNPSSTTIVSEFPSNNPVNGICASGGQCLETQSFFIDEAYMQYKNGSTSASVWQNSFKNAENQYPFDAPRDALHFIQAARATAAWNYTTSTFPLVDGLTVLQMMQNTITGLLTPCGTMDATTGQKGAYGPHGGLSQSWGNCGDQTPEPNMQAMAAFYPNDPCDFGNCGTSSGVPTITLSANATSLSTNSFSHLTASSSVTVGTDGYTDWHINIYNFANGSTVASCSSGNSCAANVTSNVGVTVGYYSAILDGLVVKATSGVTYVSWFNSSMISVVLTSTATIVPINTTVLLTATLYGLSPGQESYSILILDLNNDTTIADCSSGLTCTVFVNSLVPFSDNYMAELSAN